MRHNDSQYRNKLFQNAWFAFFENFLWKCSQREKLQRITAEYFSRAVTYLAVSETQIKFKSEKNNKFFLSLQSYGSMWKANLLQGDYGWMAVSVICTYGRCISNLAHIDYYIGYFGSTSVYQYYTVGRRRLYSIGRNYENFNS